MINEAAIVKMIVDLKTQIMLWYIATAKKYEINCKTFQKYFLSQTILRMEVHFNLQKHFNLNQKKVLVDQINMLSFQNFFGFL